ncbi:MAG: ankyrin repeat domain-containing protein [Endozoicomonadaceae bacterium]|nr:ankyrin repeat domain-containing protein [Endozoicomonadaceae bacterium]
MIPYTTIDLPHTTTVATIAANEIYCVKSDSAVSLLQRYHRYEPVFISEWETYKTEYGGNYFHYFIENKYNFSVSPSNYVNFINKLLKYNIRIDDQNKKNETALHLAIRYRAWDIAEILLKNNANPSIKDKSKWTPLHLAVVQDGQKEKQIKVIKLLCAKGANIDAKNSDGNTPLHLVKSADIADTLIKLGATMNLRNNDTETPFYVAAHNDNTKILQVMIDAKVDINEASHRGGISRVNGNRYRRINEDQTAFQIAFRRDCPGNLFCLYKAGAEINNINEIIQDLEQQNVYYGEQDIKKDEVHFCKYECNDISVLSTNVLITFLLEHISEINVSGVAVKKLSGNSREQENLKKSTLPYSVYSSFNSPVHVLKRLIPLYSLACENSQMVSDRKMQITVQTNQGPYDITLNSEPTEAALEFFEALCREDDSTDSVSGVDDMQCQGAESLANETGEQEENITKQAFIEMVKKRISGHEVMEIIRHAIKTQEPNQPE